MARHPKFGENLISEQELRCIEIFIQCSLINYSHLIMCENYIVTMFQANYGYSLVKLITQIFP